MNRQLQFHFHALEEDRRDLLDRVSKIPTEKIHLALPGKWSVFQILAHLINAERLSVRYMNKKILGIDAAENSGWVEAGKILVLKIAQRLPFKFKAPAAVVASTPAYGSLQELIADWDLERQELKLLLEKFDDAQIRKKIYRHVIAGMLNIEQAMIFLREHFHHHLPQINRLL